MKEELFTELFLPDAQRQAQVLVPKVKHYYAAGRYAEEKGYDWNSIEFIRYFMAQIVVVDGDKLSVDDIDNMALKDFNLISDAINAVVQEAPKL